MRLAWFSPWPPQSSGIAKVSATLVPALAAHGHAIDVFVDGAAVAGLTHADDNAPAPGSVRVQSAHDFVWRVTRDQYDLAIYQVGNSAQHTFLWPYLFRWPGLVVLHDTRLHHARGHARLTDGDAAAYRREFAYCHPDVSPDVAELGVAGFDGAYYYLWPMTAAVARASRLTAVHTRGGAAELQAALPDLAVEYVALSLGREAPATAAARHDARRAFGYDETHVVFGVFGGLTAEKRWPYILRAFHRTAARTSTARLLLAGAVPPASDLRQAIAAEGLTSRVTLHEGLDDEGFARALSAADVTLHLRWPTAVETSGPWLQALSDARATIISELSHQADVPALDPRSWQSWVVGAAEPPVTVAIDLEDEEHSLRLAMRRLATDAALREALGRAGRAYWEREHTMGRMVADYERAIARAAATPAPPPLPWRTPAADDRRVLLATFGDLSCELF